MPEWKLGDSLNFAESHVCSTRDFLFICCTCGEGIAICKECFELGFDMECECTEKGTE